MGRFERLWKSTLRAERFGDLHEPWARISYPLVLERRHISVTLTRIDRTPPHRTYYVISLLHPHTTHEAWSVEISSEDDAVDQYVAILWTLDANVKRPRGLAFSRVHEFVGLLDLPRAAVVDYLAAHSREVRATQVVGVEDVRLIVAFHKVDPHALDAVRHSEGLAGTILSDFFGIAVVEYV